MTPLAAFSRQRECCGDLLCFINLGLGRRKDFIGDCYLRRMNHILPSMPRSRPCSHIGTQAIEILDVIVTLSRSTSHEARAASTHWLIHDSMGPRPLTMRAWVSRAIVVGAENEKRKRENSCLRQPQRCSRYPSTARGVSNHYPQPRRRPKTASFRPCSMCDIGSRGNLWRYNGVERKLRQRVQGHRARTRFRVR